MPSRASLGARCYPGRRQWGRCAMRQSGVARRLSRATMAIARVTRQHRNGCRVYVAGPQEPVAVRLSRARTAGGEPRRGDPEPRSAARRPARPSSLPPAPVPPQVRRRGQAGTRGPRVSAQALVWSRPRARDRARDRALRSAAPYANGGRAWRRTWEVDPRVLARAPVRARARGSATMAPASGSATMASGSATDAAAGPHERP